MSKWILCLVELGNIFTYLFLFDNSSTSTTAQKLVFTIKEVGATVTECEAKVYEGAVTIMVCRLPRKTINRLMHADKLHLPLNCMDK